MTMIENYDDNHGDDYRQMMTFEEAVLGGMGNLSF